jgi:hypothetical protein
MAFFKDAFVADHLRFSNDYLQLNVNFIKVTHDWEENFYTSYAQTFNMLF